MSDALKPWKEEIDEPIRKARENVDNWHRRFGGMFTGHKVGTSEETAKTRLVGASVPPGRLTRLSGGVDNASAMFAARDNLRALAAECGDIMPTPAEITQRAMKEANP